MEQQQTTTNSFGDYNHDDDLMTIAMWQVN